MFKEDALKKLHRLYRKDKWVAELYRVIGLWMDDIDMHIRDIHAQHFSDAATWMLPIYAKEQLLDTAGKTTAEIRSAVEAGWKIGGTATIDQIQAAASSWRNGIVTVTFAGGVLVLDFSGEYGIPTDLDGFYKAIRTIVPAHLGIEYIFRWMTWNEFDGYHKTWDAWDDLNLSWDDFEKYKEVI